MIEAADLPLLELVVPVACHVERCHLRYGYQEHDLGGCINSTVNRLIAEGRSTKIAL